LDNAGVLAVAPPPRFALVPNAIAFRDPQHGMMGAGQRTGTISLTADGGRTWKVVFRAPRPVVYVNYFAQAAWARLDDGENLRSTDGGRRWTPAAPSNPWLQFSICPLGWASHDTVGDTDWSVCTTSGGAGEMGKAVYRLRSSGWQRLAYVGARGGAGGISIGGYPVGISGAHDGFGLIWEVRGPLYVTRDGGRLWTATKLVEIDFDSGASASALPHGIGFFLMQRGGGGGQVLYETTDAGRSWRVVHTWP
jgi:photosystem II stability/assembly factor-like uncharacterized protein